MSLVLLGYRLASDLAAPLLHLALARRAARGKEDPARRGERLGIASRPRPEGLLAWLHAASVGEAQSALPLVARLIGGGMSVLVTTGTVSSARLMAERLPAGAVHQFVPVDRRAWVGRFLDHWRPDIGLFVESEFWPNLILEAHARGVPLALVNARLSAHSYAAWRRAPGLAHRLLASFDALLAQDETTAARLTALGARNVLTTGTLKFAAPPLPADESRLRALNDAIGARPLWLAASVHPGEEGAIAHAHQALRARWPDLLTLVAPRHPERAQVFAQALESVGARVAWRSRGEAPDRAADAYIVDTIGELGLYFRLAPVCFVGGSLIAHGGQNPLEPARLSSAVLYGPDMRNFAAVTEVLEAAGASERVADADALAAALERLLADEGLRAARIAAAERVLKDGHGALDRIWEALRLMIDRART